MRPSPLHSVRRSGACCRFTSKYRRCPQRSQSPGAGSQRPGMMTRSWPLLLESTAMLLLFTVMVVVGVFRALETVFSVVCIIGFVVVGIAYFVMNVVAFVHLLGDSNTVWLVILLFTQTVLLHPLRRRVWLAFCSVFENDLLTKIRETLRAKYSICATTRTAKDLPRIDEEHTLGTCVPSRRTRITTPEPVVTQAAESLGDSQGPSEMSPTEFRSNTKTISLPVDTTGIYAGERHSYKYVLRTIKHLLIAKKLSYHIVTNPTNDIIHVSKSKTHAEELPDRVVQKEPLVVCNDTHYILSFTKFVWFESFHVIKRNGNLLKTIQQVDLNRFIWQLVWPTTIIMIYAAFNPYHLRATFRYVGPSVGTIVWLLTWHGVEDQWDNILLLMPLRIFFTVSRTLLVCAIAQNWFFPALSIYITAKVTGIIALSIYLTIAKVRWNNEPFSDPIDKYCFDPLLHPLIQLVESAVYCSWGFGWCFQDKPDHYEQGLLALVVICQFAGIVWQRVYKRFSSNILRDPVKVLQITQDRIGESV